MNTEQPCIVNADGLGLVAVTDPIRKQILRCNSSYSSGNISVWCPNVIDRKVQRFVPFHLYDVIKALHEIQMQ